MACNAGGISITLHSGASFRPGRSVSRMPRRRQQRGAFAVMFAGALLVILPLCGLAIEVGMIYNRKAELQGVAQAAALAAARQLNGTSGGISAAVAAARDAANRLRVKYGQRIQWDDSAVMFSNSPARTGDWSSAGSAQGQAATMYYAKVDTGALAAETGLVETVFMQILTGEGQSVTVQDDAVAGRATVNVVPLAVCAMSPTAAAARTNPGPPATVELVEYGFRRGVSYDLMQLNPHGTSPASYVVDPLAPPGGLGSASNTSASAVEDFVCTGRMWIPRVTGGRIRVGSPFPIASLYRQLNSRFDQYSGSRCSVNGAPPDYNIKEYTPGATGAVTWMNPKPASQSALSTTARGRLETIADLDAPPSGTPGSAYGPLWTYTKAVKFSAYSPGADEPSNGYAKFGTSDWKSLYPASPSLAATGYPSSGQPYQATSGSSYAAPSSDHLPFSMDKRRVLHIPLLECPVAAGANVGATALAIGKFFMTVPATPSSLHAEFAGLIPESRLAGQVILYP